MRGKLSAGALALSLFALSFGAVTAPAATAQDATLQYQSTQTNVGETPRDAVYSSSQNRVYVLSDILEDPQRGEVTWLDAATNTVASESWALPAAKPNSLAISADESKLYVAHYRNGVFSVVDTATGVATAINGIPKFPTGIVEDTRKGTVYVYDSSGLYVVDVANQTVSAKISVSDQKYPLIKSVVYDDKNQILWIAEGRAKVLTAFSTATGEWMQNVAIPLSTIQFGGEEIGGRASTMALDTELNLLHIVMGATFSDDWAHDRVITFDTEARQIVGTNYIEVGENVYDAVVNPDTHELYTTDGFSNTVSVVSPETWTASTAADFNALGVTSGTGSGSADTWGIALNGDTVYVTHPYHNSRMSILTRVGDKPQVTVRPVNSNGQTPATPAAEPWAGPAKAATTEASFCAVSSDTAKLEWGFSEYLHAWKVSLRGSTEKIGDQYVWNNGSGWYNPNTGEAEISWADGIHIQHYEVLVPELTSAWGNPVLKVNADGSATLTADVAWTAPNNVTSNGYKRVTMATFKAVTLTQTVTGFTLTGTPDWEGRQYTDARGRVSDRSYPAEFINYYDEQMQAWWYATGANMDPQKRQLNISVNFAATQQSKCAPTQALTLSVNEGQNGAEVTAEATGFTPGEEVAFALHSDPIALGTATANASGVATLKFTVPAAAAVGAHSVIATQANGPLTANAAFTVLAAQQVQIAPNTGGTAAQQGATTATAQASGSDKTGLAATGVDTLPLAVVAALTVLAGLSLALRRKA